MNIKEFIQLFVPPIYYKVKKRLCPKKEVERHPLPKIDHKSNRMIVIGNGPSLKKTVELYEQQLHEADCVMVNFSARTPLFDRIRPSYYVMTDPGWSEENGSDRESVDACIDAIVTKTNWPMTIVLPSHLKSWWAIEDFKKNKNITILFDGGVWQPLPDKELFPALDENIVCPPSYTVLTYCLYIAIYFGYKETYLVGADTSFLKDMYVGQNDNILYTIDSHYYNNNEVCPLPTDPEFNGRPFGRTMEQELFDVYMMFYEYNMLNRYAQWKGVKVYNASEFSMIDCFERKKLSD